MNKTLTIFLVSVGAVTVAYLYYRSQKKAKPIITLPALAPAVTPTAAPTWLEALKSLVSPSVTEAVSVAPTYKAPAPTYKAPAPTYKAPAPKYEPTWWGIPGGGVPSK